MRDEPHPERRRLPRGRHGLRRVPARHGEPTVQLAEGPEPAWRGGVRPASGRARRCPAHAVQHRPARRQRLRCTPADERQVRRALPGGQILRRGGNGAAESLPERPLLSAGHRDAAAVRSGHIRRRGRPERRRPVHAHQPRILRDGGQHRADAVQPRHRGSQRQHASLRRVRAGHVSGRAGPAQLPRLPERPLLSAGHRDAAAVRSGHIRRRGRPERRRPVHAHQPRILRDGGQHRADAVQPRHRGSQRQHASLRRVRAGHVSGRAGPAQLPRLRPWKLLGQRALLRALQRRRVLPCTVSRGHPLSGRLHHRRPRRRGPRRVRLPHGDLRQRRSRGEAQLRAVQPERRGLLAHRPHTRHRAPASSSLAPLQSHGVHLRVRQLRLSRRRLEWHERWVLCPRPRGPTL